MSHLAIFCADATRVIGAGHLRRCMVLACELRRAGWQIGFATVEDSLQIVPELGELDFDIKFTNNGVNEIKSNWPGGCSLLVVDHYALDAEFELSMRNWAQRILVIDDLPIRQHEPDILIDPTIGRRSIEYLPLIRKGCQTLLGGEYALLRPSFVMHRFRRLAHKREKFSTLLVAMGATDPFNFTSKILEDIGSSGFEGTVIVLLGQQAPNLENVRSVSLGIEQPIEIHIEQPDPAQLMARADIAICTASTIALECCVLGIPQLVVTSVLNQRDVGKGLTSGGSAESLGEIGEFNSVRFQTIISNLINDCRHVSRMSEFAKQLCDGFGVTRVVEVIESSYVSDRTPRVALRSACLDDWEKMLNWQREPVSRKYSRNAEPPDELTHRVWLEDHLDRSDSLIFMLEFDGRDVGILRLDWDGEAFEVSILVDPKMHRLGIGRQALELARKLVPWSTLTAYIDSNNVGSVALFASAGYEPRGENYVKRPET